MNTNAATNLSSAMGEEPVEPEGKAPTRSSAGDKRLEQGIVTTGLGLLLIAYLMLLGHSLRTWSPNAVSLAWVSLWAPLTWELIRKLKLSREFSRNSKYKKTSWLYPFLGVGVFSAILCAALASVPASALLLTMVAGVDDGIWLAVMFLLPFWVALRFQIFRWGHRHHLFRYQKLGFDRKTLWVSTVLAIVLLGGVMLFIPQPNYVGLPFLDALRHTGDEVVKTAPWLQPLAALVAAKDGAVDWVTQSVITHTPWAQAALPATFALLALQVLWVVPLILLLQLLAGQVSGWQPEYSETGLGPIARAGMVVVIGLLIAGPLAKQNPFQDWVDPDHTIRTGDEFWEVRESELRELQPAEEWLAGPRQEVLESLLSKADAKIDRLFEQLHAHVPEYLDWYYSVSGRGERALASTLQFIPGDPGMGTAEMLAEKLIPEDYETKLAELEADLLANYQSEINRLPHNYLDALTTQLEVVGGEPTPAVPDPGITDLSTELATKADSLLDSNRALASWAGAFALGTLSPRALRKFSGKLETAASKNAKTGIKLSRVLGKIGFFGGRAASCAPTALAGPLGLITCGAVVVGSTLAIEKGAAEIEELSERDTHAMRLHKLIDRQRDTAVKKHHQAAEQMFKSDAAALESKIKQRIRPIDMLRDAN